MIIIDTFSALLLNAPDALAPIVFEHPITRELLSPPSAIDDYTKVVTLPNGTVATVIQLKPSDVALSNYYGR